MRKRERFETDSSFLLHLKRVALLEENKRDLEHFKESVVPWDILHITRLLVIVFFVNSNFVGDKRVLN